MRRLRTLCQRYNLEFTRAAKSLKMCPRFSARGELFALSTTFSAGLFSRAANGPILKKRGRRTRPMSDS
jgi:hypothetical protein